MDTDVGFLNREPFWSAMEEIAFMILWPLFASCNRHINEKDFGC